MHIADTMNFTVASPTAGPIHTAAKIASHASRSSRVLLNIPGYDGEANGYRDKYVKIADHLADNSIAGTMRTDNTCWEPRTRDCYPEYGQALVQNCVRFIRTRPSLFSHTRDPDIYVAGMSAGASIAAAFAPQLGIKKMLLISPTTAVGLDNMLDGLSRYRGELCIVYGSQDQLINDDRIMQLLEAASLTTRCEAIKLHGCDHEFSGELNGRILSQAYLWAFNNDTTFPNPYHGIPIY